MNLKSKNFILLSLVVSFCICIFCSCSDDDKDNNQIKLDQDNLTIETDKEVQLNIIDAPTLTTVWYSSDKTIATVTNKGLVTGIKPGTAIITADIGYAKAKCEVTVIGISSMLSLDALSAPLSDNIIYSKNIQLIAPLRVMQGFDIDSKGNLYYIQIGKKSSGDVDKTKSHELYVIKSTPNSSDISIYMTFRYFGHGSNFVVEESGNDTYVWLNSNASKTASSSEYENSVSFSRIKFEPGKVIENGYGGETFFLNNGKKNTHPAIDFENRRLCISATESGTRNFYVYDLDEALALPNTSFTFDVTFGGEESTIPEQTVSKTVEGKDLAKLTPLGSFSIPKGKDQASDLNSHSLQGFDIVGNYIYYNEGDGNGNDITNGNSNDYVTILDINGNIVHPRTAVTAITNIDNLKTAGITDSGYMEGEGIKVKGNKIYLGFASRRNPNIAGNDDYRRANIFVYDCSNK